MTNEPRFWAVIFIGPPGSGKDTQAELLASELGLIEIRSSKIIQENFAKISPDDPMLIEQKKRLDAGGLVESKITSQWIMKEVMEAASQHKGIVFNGSPRTIEEAELEMPELKKIYGDNVIIINIDISEGTSISRNSRRRVCEKNGHPIPDFEEFKNLTICPQDGSPIIVRSLDTPETIKKRYQVYLTETAPVLDFFKEKGYNVITIKGEQPIEDIHRDILNRLW